ncbi:MAG: BREX-2 system adenine-specific DNA-methyltransferase PglX [Polyangiaceae bacterium]|nr:BREX-2 system adenine-specific DNA-methyltransferase PglX [Polyangiaceae bacterium]
MAAKKTTDKPKAPKAPKPKKAAAPRDLTKELSQLLAKKLLPDLQARVSQEPTVHAALFAEHQRELKQERTADPFKAWLERQLEQIGVAWVLSLVFIRTLEDRGYLSHPRVAGEGALDSEHVFFELFPALSHRDYVLAVFRELAHLPGGQDVLGRRHNPAWRLSPSAPMVRELLAFFRETTTEGALVWAFPGASTRFLGDLYQDISESVRERYALLQTPEFVEELILEQTLDPAIADRGLEHVSVLDPTCGSGHFLLGAFRRLFEAHQRKAPGLSNKQHAGKALSQVYGADINPYAAAIARFRLLLAYLEAAGIDKLAQAPNVEPNVVIADSLLYAAKDATLSFATLSDDAHAWGEAIFQLDDPEAAKRLFAKRFDVVVGNPPYITCKDPTLRERYRKAYASAAGKYALAAPFTERFFQLASDGGYVGLINANSFMKREFGKKLIEEVLPRVNLTRVVDTAGAFIPGHGTPTVLLFGRNQPKIGTHIRAVLGKRGEPETPADPENGLVWSSIRDHLDEVGFENDFISVADVPRETFEKHPWSLGGGGAAELKELLEERAEKRLGDLATIGVGGMSNADDVYLRELGSWTRFGMPEALVRRLVIGEDLRDWSHTPTLDVVFPYDAALKLVALDGKASRLLWPYRGVLWARAVFGGGDYRSSGRTWWEWHQVTVDRYRTPLSIAFAFVATHNHFVLDRGGKVFNRSAPIIKLPETATEDDHLVLLAYLNSSTACFYARQVLHSKGAQGVNEGLKAEEWEQFLEFSGTQVAQFPLPPQWQSLAPLARSMLDLAARRQRLREALADTVVRDPESWRGAALEEGAVLDAMVALQEHLDFEVYRLFDLVPKAPSLPDRLAPGHRAFEVQLVRDKKRTAWFTRHGFSEPADTQPGLDELDLPATVRLIEQPVFKRRWLLTDWASVAVEVRTGIVLEALEKVFAGASDGKTLSWRALGHSLPSGVERDADDGPAQWVADEAVPYLAALRYTDTGLAKRAEWEVTWALQRREDAGEQVEIPVPPKYDTKDYRDPIYWRLRGKLDVPKERFISYPGAERDDDKSPIYGWAGWDHLQQATALAGLYHERKNEDGWGADETGRARLVPLLAGLLELVPWLKQWHNQPNDDFGGDGPGDWYERYVEGEARAIGRSLDDLRAWRPPSRGRRR